MPGYPPRGGTPTKASSCFWDNAHFWDNAQKFEELRKAVASIVGMLFGQVLGN